MHTIVSSQNIIEHISQMLSWKIFILGLKYFISVTFHSLILAYANTSLCNFNVRESAIIVQRVKMRQILSLKINNANNHIKKYLHLLISLLNKHSGYGYGKELHKRLKLSIYIVLHEKAHCNFNQ